MKIIILGAGQVGSSVAANLCSEANDITLVDIEAAILLQRLRKSGDAMPLPLQLFAKEHWSHSHIQDWIQDHFRAKDHAKTTKRVPKPTPAPPKRRALLEAG